MDILNKHLRNRALIHIYRYIYAIFHINSWSERDYTNATQTRKVGSFFLPQFEVGLGLGEIGIGICDWDWDGSKRALITLAQAQNFFFHKEHIVLLIEIIV